MGGLQEITRFFPSNGEQTRVWGLRRRLGVGKDDMTVWSPGKLKLQGGRRWLTGGGFVPESHTAAP